MLSNKDLKAASSNLTSVFINSKWKQQYSCLQVLPMNKHSLNFCCFCPSENFLDQTNMCCFLGRRGVRWCGIVGKGRGCWDGSSTGKALSVKCPARMTAKTRVIMARSGWMLSPWWTQRLLANENLSEISHFLLDVHRNYCCCLGERHLRCCFLLGHFHRFVRTLETFGQAQKILRFHLCENSASQPKMCFQPMSRCICILGSKSIDYVP